MINLYVSTMVYKPVQQVFDFISTPENDFQWQYATLETTRLSGSGNGIGSIFRSISNLMGHRIISTFEVTAYEPNKKYNFKSLSGPLHLQTSYTFEISNGGTKIGISTQISMVDFDQTNESLMEKSLKKQLKENLAMLKALLETKRTSLVARPGSFTTEV